jgi:hypothetical protein
MPTAYQSQIPRRTQTNPKTNPSPTHNSNKLKDCDSAIRKNGAPAAMQSQKEPEPLRSPGGAPAINASSAATQSGKEARLPSSADSPKSEPLRRRYARPIPRCVSALAFDFVFPCTATGQNLRNLRRFSRTEATETPIPRAWTPPCPPVLPLTLFLSAMLTCRIFASCDDSREPRPLRRRYPRPIPLRVLRFCL